MNRSTWFAVFAAATVLTGLSFVRSARAATADFLFPTSMQSHYLPLASVPTSTTAVYTTDVWLKAMELIPQSTTSPTCTVTDGLGNLLYPTITLTPNHSYRDTRQDTAPLLAKGGFTASCSDGTVKVQWVVMY